MGAISDAAIAKYKSDVLGGCTIAISGTYQGHTHGDLAKLIAIAGGTHATKISDKTTHLITTASDVQKHSTKVKQAERHDAIVNVGVNWLTASVYSGKRADEAAYRPSDAPPQSVSDEAVDEKLADIDNLDDVDQATEPAPAPAPAPDAGSEAEPGLASGDASNKTRARKKKDAQESVEKGPAQRQTRSARAKAEQAAAAAPDAKADVADEPEDDERAPEMKENGDAAEKDTKKRTRSGRAKAQPVAKAAPEAGADAQSEADDNKQPLKKQKKTKKGEAVDEEILEAKDEEMEQAKDEAAGDTQKRTRKRTAKAQDDAPSQTASKPQASKPATRAKGGAAAGSADAEDSKKKSSTKAAKDSQKAGTQQLVIPLDEGCPLVSTHRVLIDSDGVVFDASLNQTNAGANNNKFYRIQLLESSTGDYRTWTRWGRVGEHGQSKMLGTGSLAHAMSEFEKKFKDKSGLRWEDRHEPPRKGKYVFIERSYEPDSNDASDAKAERTGRSKPAHNDDDDDDGDEDDWKPPESKLAPAVQRLMQLIFNQQYFTATMASMRYDANKLPLGKLNERTLLQGFETLKQLADVLAHPELAVSLHNTSYAAAVNDLSNLYYSYIPHDFGRSRPPLISSDEMLKREVEILESLSDMSIAEEIMKISADKRSTAAHAADAVHPLDRQFAGLNLAEMTPLEPASAEFQLLNEYLLKTHGDTHGYLHLRVQDAFRIERGGERERFERSPYAALQQQQLAAAAATTDDGAAAASRSDRRLLWHGSRCTNYGGILSQGLRIAPPEAPVSGYMFGKGIYLADMASKSASYCVAGLSGNVGLLLLCEAELGRPLLELTHADSDAGARARSRGCFATWGRGSTTPAGWKDAGCLHEELRGVLMPDTTKPPGPSGVANASLLYDEFICYDVAQIRLRYLLRVDMR